MSNISNNDINEEELIEQKENERSNKFNLIIGISTLLIAILGATFAYFSAIAQSNENDVNVKSAYVSISYDGGTEIAANNLIPSSEYIAISKYQKAVEENDGSTETIEQDGYTNDIARKCIDSKGHEVCSVYQFSVKSDGEVGSTTALNGYIKINVNQFKNLSYVLYEVEYKTDENGEYVLDKYGNKIVLEYTVRSEFNKTETSNALITTPSDVKFATFEQPTEDTSSGEVQVTYPVACIFGYSDNYESLGVDNPERCKSYNLSNQETHNYQILMWLEETGEVQEEQGLSFKGTVSLEVPTGQDSSEEQVITGRE